MIDKGIETREAHCPACYQQGVILSYVSDNKWKCCMCGYVGILKDFKLKKVKKVSVAGKSLWGPEERFVKRDPHQGWRIKLEEYDWKCVYCDKQIGFGDAVPTKDHIIPRAFGGMNGLDNIVPSCVACNKVRGTLYLKDFNIDVFNKLIQKGVFKKRLIRYPEFAFCWECDSDEHRVHQTKFRYCSRCERFYVREKFIDVPVELKKAYDIKETL